MADPAITVTTSAGDGSDSVGPWAAEVLRLTKAGTDFMLQTQAHYANLNRYSEGMISDSRSTANFADKKFAVLFTEPNAESAGAENTMKAGNVAELTAAAVQNVIGTANADLAASMADLKAMLAASLGDLKAVLAGERGDLTAAILNAALSAANQVPTRPSNQAVETGKA